MTEISPSQSCALPSIIMLDLTISERQTFAAVLELAIREDLGKAGDITSLATIPAQTRGKAVFIARRDGVLAGLPACKRTLERIDPAIEFKPLLNDGDRLGPG